MKDCKGRIKIIRTSTVPISLNILLKGQLHFLAKSYEVIGVSSSGRDLEETSSREGIKTLSVNMERGISPIKDLISLFQLYQVIQRERPTIVHSITPKAGLLTMLAGKMAGVPFRLHTFTGLIFPSKTGFAQKLLIKMDQLLCWAATNIYPEGNGVKNDLERFRITRKPLKVLGNGNVNGIDLNYFCKKNIPEYIQDQLKQQLKIEKNDFVFVFVGRLVGDKGINELIQAFSTADFFNAKLLLVGDLESDLDPLMDKTLQEMQTNKNIICTGFQKDVRPYFAIADALVFPSYREGFPNVVLQAGAMELPSIVTDINGANEIIVEGKNGTIIPIKDVTATQKAMRRFIDDDAFFNLLKGNARAMIESRYEQSVVWNAVLAEYNLLIKNLTKEQNH